MSRFEKNTFHYFSQLLKKVFSGFGEALQKSVMIS